MFLDQIGPKVGRATVPAAIGRHGGRPYVCARSKFLFWLDWTLAARGDAHVQDKRNFFNRSTIKKTTQQLGESAQSTSLKLPQDGVRVNHRRERCTGWIGRPCFRYRRPFEEPGQNMFFRSWDPGDIYCNTGL